MLEFILGTGSQTLVINSLTIWVCWYLGYGTDTYLPWCLVVLQWTGNWINYQAGLFRGALGFYRLPEAQKARAIELFNRLDNEPEDKA